MAIVMLAGASFATVATELNNRASNQTCRKQEEPLPGRATGV